MNITHQPLHNTVACCEVKRPPCSAKLPLPVQKRDCATYRAEPQIRIQSQDSFQVDAMSPTAAAPPAASTASPAAHAQPHQGSAPPAMPESLLPAETQQQISARCGQMLQGAISSLCVYLGHELGLYKTLQQLGPITAQQLAAAAGLSQRWVQDWLYQQSSSRLVCCDTEAQRWVVASTDNKSLSAVSSKCRISYWYHHVAAGAWCAGLKKHSGGECARLFCSCNACMPW